MPLSALTGTLLRERRLALGLRQADLAGRAQISASYLNLIEHNRRKVTPEVLVRLAAALGLEVTDLAEGAGSALIEDLRAGAALAGGTGEVDRAEDFAGRFPGWAGVVAALYRRSEGLERMVEALNDRMSHDPYLSASLHEVLSAVSSVRSTAAILAETQDIDPAWQARFLRNLHQDSERLALGAEALVGYLDGSDEAAVAGAGTPQDEVDAWLTRRRWQMPEVEAGFGAGEGSLRAEIAAMASDAARGLAEVWVAQARADAQALPLAAFGRALDDLGPDPALLADRFGVGLLQVMRRIALMPGARAGLVTCDASGTLILRKPASGFAMPRFGAACPVWPLYTALSHPGSPVDRVVQTPGRGERHLRVLAYCQPRHPGGFAAPEVREAAMLILPDDAPGPGLPIGSTCRICPRGACVARREPSILTAPA